MARLTRWMQKVLGRATNPPTLVTGAKAPTTTNRTGQDEEEQSMVRSRHPTPRAIHERRWPPGPHQGLKCDGRGEIMVVLLGSPGIGRRSLINKLLYDDMHGGELYELSMLMMEDEIPRYICGDYIYQLDLIMSANDSKFYYASGWGHNFFSVVLAYDVYSQASFDEVSHLYDTISVHQKSGQPKINILILGLKADLLDGAGVRVPRETGEAFASVRGCSFAECSAKSGDGVYEAFGSLVEYAYGITAQFSGDGEGRTSFNSESRTLLNRAMQSVSTT